MLGRRRGRDLSIHNGDMSQVPLAEDMVFHGPVASFDSAEVLEIREGAIVRGELIYDAEELRKAMGPRTTG
jgi:hypothetical protein